MDTFPASCHKPTKDLHQMDTIIGCFPHIDIEPIVDITSSCHRKQFEIRKSG